MQFAWNIHPYSRIRELAFICIPKNASSSVRHVIKHSVKDFSELAISELRCRPIETAFTFVRHPCARLEACYKDKILRGNGLTESGFPPRMDWETFVMRAAENPAADPHLMPQAEIIRYATRNYACDLYIGRVERLDVCWEEIRRDFPWLHTLPRLNTSGNGWTAAWTYDLLNAVHKSWACDFEEFNYEIGI